MSITTNPDPYVEELEQEIERLRSDRPDWAEYQRLINENNQQRAEIERLNCALTISRGKHENAIAWNAKLQTVVERIATRDYDETAQEFARATLEDDDD